MKIEWMGLALAFVLAQGRAHADAKMWTIAVERVTIQDVDDKDQPKGKPRPVPVRVDGVLSCRLTIDAAGKTFEPWVQGSVDPSGHLRMRHDQGGAPEDVIDCASQALVNMKVASKSGEYRLTATVKFRP